MPVFYNIKMYGIGSVLHNVQPGLFHQISALYDIWRIETLLVWLSDF